MARGGGLDSAAPAIEFCQALREFLAAPKIVREPELGMVSR